MVSTSQVPISVCLGKMPHFIFHDSLLLFSSQFTVRSVSSRTLSLTAWVMSRKAMITGWSYLMMDSADRGFGKMAPLLHLPCKCLREILQEKEETWGNSKFYFILYLRFSPKDIVSMIITQAFDCYQTWGFQVFLLLGHAAIKL